MANLYIKQLVLGLVIIYLISFFMAKKNIITIITHKKIWNIILLISFILVAITSISFLLLLEYGIYFSIPNNSFWHTELGIVMILISLFHSIWHLAYFKAILGFKNR